MRKSKKPFISEVEGRPASLISTPAPREEEEAEVVGEIPLPQPSEEIPVIEEVAVEVLPADDWTEALDSDEPKEKVSPAAGSREIARYDALTAYLREISRYPALTREEEHKLAIQFHDHKDLEAAYKLVRSNLWLVVKIAREYERAARNLLDLVQEGNIGLMEAVKNFDPYRGVRLPSYAVWWIKAYIVRYVIANWRLVKIGTTQAQRKLFFNLKKEKERLEREGFSPTPKLLAEKLDVRESDVVEMEQRLGSPDMSVDTPLQAGSDTTLLSLLPDSRLNAEDTMALKEQQTLLEASLRDFVGTLNEKERLIFESRLLAEEKATLQEISDRVGVSKERVRQIENNVKNKLKSFLERKFGDSLDAIEAQHSRSPRSLPTASGSREKQ